MKLKINIPEKLSEITLGQYQDWLKVAEGKEMTPFIQQKMIEIFCGITLKEVLMIKATDIDSITNEILKVFEQKPKFIKEFEIDKMQFGFIPKLDDMVFGEYIDLDTYLGDWSQMHKAMNVLFRPIIFKKNDQYLVSDYEGTGKYNLKTMPLSIVFGSLVFFWNLRNELQKHILSYLANQTDIPVSQELRDSLKSGVGINPFTDLAKVTL
tara:strand:- start:600 stop:1229 length:630 start_codon:yes stop_codon:yes gene_type:complete